MKRKHKYILIAVVVLVLVWFILPFLNIFKGEMDIDLNSGKCRSRYYVCGVKIIDSIGDTKLSRLVSETIGIDSPPQWKLETKWNDFPRRFSQGGRFKSSCDSFVDHLDLGEELGHIDHNLKIKFIKEYISYLKTKDIEKMEELCEKVALFYQEKEYPEQPEPNNK